MKGTKWEDPEISLVSDDETKKTTPVGIPGAFGGLMVTVDVVGCP